MSITCVKVDLSYPPSIHHGDSIKIDRVLDIDGVTAIDYYHDVIVTVRFDHLPTIKEIQAKDKLIKLALDVAHRF